MPPKIFRPPIIRPGALDPDDPTRDPGLLVTPGQMVPSRGFDAYVNIHIRVTRAAAMLNEINESGKSQEDKVVSIVHATNAMIGGGGGGGGGYRSIMVESDMGGGACTAVSESDNEAFIREYNEGQSDMPTLMAAFTLLLKNEGSEMVEAINQIKSASERAAGVATKSTKSAAKKILKFLSDNATMIMTLLAGCFGPILLFVYGPTILYFIYISLPYYAVQTLFTLPFYNLIVFLSFGVLTTAGVTFAYKKQIIFFLADYLLPAINYYITDESQTAGAYTSLITALSTLSSRRSRLSRTRTVMTEGKATVSRVTDVIDADAQTEILNEILELERQIILQINMKQNLPPGDPARANFNRTIQQLRVTMSERLARLPRVGGKLYIKKRHQLRTKRRLNKKSKRSRHSRR